MFNHVRTLLLAADGRQSYGPTFPGEEGVPVGFRPPVMPGPVRRIRSVLFGPDPDRLGLNYRLHQFMTLLHATDLVEHVLAFDQRVTYDPTGASWPSTAFGVTVEGSNRPLHLVGTFQADDATGRLEGRWRVEIGSGTAQVTQDSFPRRDELVSISTADGVTSEIPLGRGLRCYGDPTPGTVWHVTARSRPERSLVQILADLVASGAVGDLLSGETSEYATYRNLWAQSPLLPYRLGAVLMGTARRTHEAMSREA